MLAEISAAISRENINIKSVATRSVNGRAVLDFVVEVRSREELQKLLNTIRGIKGVIAAKRIQRERVKQIAG